MSARKKIIGITLGDVNGVGPEIAIASAFHNWPPSVRIILIGDHDIIRAECRRQRRPLLTEWDLDQRHLPKQVYGWNPTSQALSGRQPGQLSPHAAQAAHDWICAAARAALQGSLDAVVTAPINKEGFLKAGIDVSGHTELLARIAKVKRFEMMLCAGNFRVVLATRHLPLRDVADSVTRKGIIQTVTMTAEALDWMGARNKHIAVCGLNPHAGDGGAIGIEERTVIAPAIRILRRHGMEVTGPVPADTVFYQVRQGAYDAVVAMYHDQGLAPFKMMAFNSGVNITLGLPFVRTSPDHGTAYDCAGSGRANPASMIEAVKLAVALAHRRNPWQAS